MAIGFKQIPPGIRVPLFYAEVDPSLANTGTINQRALIVGQITSAGTATPGVPVISNGAAEAKTLGGPGSMLALMVAAYRANDNFGEVWLLPLADNGAGAAATGSIAVTGPATANGTIALYVAGQLVSVAVASGQTANQVAASINTAINAATDLPVTSTVATNTVTLTAKNKGPQGNDIDLRVNYQGSAGGEALPAGLALAITGMASGATPPSLTTPFANLGDQPFDFIAFPYNDTTSLDALKSLLDDVTGRWSWDRQVYGHGFAALRGTFSALTTAGVLRNDQHASIIGFYDSPTPSFVWAAALTGAAAASLRVDPALPLQTLQLSGVLAPPLQSRFDLGSRNTLLYDGISTFTVGDDGTVRIENCITTYQKNAFSQPDNSYLEVETLFTLAFVLRFMKTAITTKFARVKLAADGTRLSAGSGVVTPSTIRAELIAQYRQLEAAGLVQNGDAFKDAIIVQKNASNPNRVDVLWPGTLIGALRIFAVLAQFRLQ